MPSIHINNGPITGHIDVHIEEGQSLNNTYLLAKVVSLFVLSNHSVIQSTLLWSFKENGSNMVDAFGFHVVIPMFLSLKKTQNLSYELLAIHSPMVVHKRTKGRSLDIKQTLFNVLCLVCDQADNGNAPIGIIKSVFRWITGSKTTDAYIGECLRDLSNSCIYGSNPTKGVYRIEPRALEHLSPQGLEGFEMIHLEEGRYKHV